MGTVFAFISNEKLNDSIQHFNNTVNTAIDHSLDFVLDTQTVSCSMRFIFYNFLLSLLGGKHNC